MAVSGSASSRTRDVALNVSRRQRAGLLAILAARCGDFGSRSASDQSPARARICYPRSPRGRQPPPRVGADLFAAAAEFAREQDCSGAEVTTAECRLGAHRFHESFRLLPNSDSFVLSDTYDPLTGHSTEVQPPGPRLLAEFALVLWQLR